MNIDGNYYIPIDFINSPYERTCPSFIGIFACNMVSDDHYLTWVVSFTLSIYSPTYLVFVIFVCYGMPWTFITSPEHNSLFFFYKQAFIVLDIRIPLECKVHHKGANLSLKMLTSILMGLRVKKIKGSFGITPCYSITLIAIIKI